MRGLFEWQFGDRDVRPPRLGARTVCAMTVVFPVPGMPRMSA